MIKVLSLTISPKAKQRLAWMDSYRECGNAAQVARHFSISVRTFWYWKRRYDPWNLKSLEDRSRKPRSSPRQSSTGLTLAILALKRKHPRWGKEKMALVLQNQGFTISASTCYRICKKHQLVVKYRTRKRRAPKPRVNWESVRLPGDLIQIDTKHLTLPHGRRAYQFTAIDVVTRWRYVDFHDRCDQIAALSFLKGLLNETVFKVKMVQSDNGSEFASQVTRFLQDKKIKHVFSHKRRPQENAYVERSHRTDEEEFYSLGNLCCSLTELKERFTSYLAIYHNERPHWGLKGQTPQQAINHYLTSSTVQDVLT